ncbi:1-(5-phosphoribosyl)-5-[(5-phosphoribosylamino)methylideneamino] imidazole-4-carboxamide isomerase [Polyangium aurulentum]|uniref:1-(5-phosphoribosyl)-5-[(5- phosphoribosylamino)methylideneamino] imidazole-4-carboxamide isomerase n=1 Tax=Polyangium aurulentum TaxID=2567896 RepID=UPI0010AE5801|nr:1-(5-phosphoribosyl)-5-[(5-phosphoribosylamino)methylideneamino] imidazole-4-carboxamide isomerase [Polyangium aurulentum]UQA58185.1 1-(5-phosphoribosyl)-5-[(5-phosphoribosylamino)methylideneamino] imidazole-4-carboxamide isomerase [Polyangium aurulentum]
MHILPAIDLLEGKAVRLHQGRYDQVTVYHPDPVALAAELRGKTPLLHLVDLEGAREGKPVQEALVRAIIQAFGPGVEVGGGVRSAETAEAYLALGADRVVLGTAAIDDEDLVRRLAHAHPGRVVVALDAKDGLVATKGWLETSSRSALEVAQGLAGAPLFAILYTDIARDGTGAGPNIPATAALAREGGFPVIASGGVGSLDHLRALACIPGVIGAIVGRALYERAFSLEEALAAAAPIPYPPSRG